MDLGIMCFFRPDACYPDIWYLTLDIWTLEFWDCGHSGFLYKYLESGWFVYRLGEVPGRKALPSQWKLDWPQTNLHRFQVLPCAEERTCPIYWKGAANCWLWSCLHKFLRDLVRFYAVEHGLRAKWLCNGHQLDANSTWLGRWRLWTRKSDSVTGLVYQLPPHVGHGEEMWSYKCLGQLVGRPGDPKLSVTFSKESQAFQRERAMFHAHLETFLGRAWRCAAGQAVECNGVILGSSLKWTSHWMRKFLPPCNKQR